MQLLKSSFAAAAISFLCACSSSGLKERPAVTPDGKSALKVSGNKIVNEAGQPVMMQGLALVDPLVTINENQWNEKFFDHMADWNAKLIRVPVTPTNWNRKGKDFYFKVLDQAVEWAGSRGMYLIVDWHSIGNVKDEKFQRPGYNTTMKETIEFWSEISKRYAGEKTIAFYEVFNEPTDFFGKLGKLSWDEWRETVEKISAEIRKNDKDTIILAGGLRWCYDLTPAKEKPFRVKNLAYAVHPYPMKAKDDRKKGTMEQQWTKTWGFIADKYPMVATEFGFMSKDEPGSHVPCIGDDSYGKRLINYFNEKTISWTVWCFHWSWKPALIDRNYKPATTEGKFFHKVMTDNIRTFPETGSAAE